MCNEIKIYGLYLHGGEGVSIENIYKENYPIVFGFLVSLTKDRALAEELTAETFYKAIIYIKKYDGKYKISSWLCQIAKNEYFKYYNSHKKLIGWYEMGESLEDKPGLDEMFIDKNFAMEIHSLLHKLEEPYKEVFNLRIFAELSFHQIGTILDKSENWARVTFYRAKIKIIKQMEEKYGEEM